MVRPHAWAALATAALALPLAASAELISGSQMPDAYTWYSGANSVMGVVSSVVQFLITIASIVAAIFIMYAGWLYLTSAGDTGKIQKAHKIFRDIAVGFGLLIAAWLIVVTLLKAFGAAPWVLRFFPQR